MYSSSALDLERVYCHLADHESRLSNQENIITRCGPPGSRTTSPISIADLSKMELKKILIEKMEANKSIHEDERMMIRKDPPLDQTRGLKDEKKEVSLHQLALHLKQQPGVQADLPQGLNLDNYLPVNTKFLNTLPPEWSKFVTDVKLVRDLHTTNVDQLLAYLGQHEYHANEVRLMHERNSDPLALSSVNHNVYYPSSSMPHVEYAPAAHPKSKFSPPDTGLIVLVFQKGDDPIDAINHMMSFLTLVVTSRYPSTNNQLKTSSNPRQHATINNGRVAIQPIQGRQISMTAGSSRPYTPGSSETSGPPLNEMTPATISLGLVQKSSFSTPYVPPSRNNWDLLFQPMFDELLNPPSSVDHQAAEVIGLIADVIPPVQADSTGLSSSTTADQDAPSPSKSHTKAETQSSVIPQDVEEDNLDIKVAHMGNDLLFGVPIPEVTSA
nr:hypothetical protein [Tanacetum cinerariifolium]